MRLRRAIVLSKASLHWDGHVSFGANRGMAQDQEKARATQQTPALGQWSDKPVRVASDESYSHKDNLLLETLVPIELHAPTTHGLSPFN